MNGVDGSYLKNTYREEGSGIGSGNNDRFKNGADEAKGNEEEAVTALYKKISGDGIGAVWKKISDDDDFVMVDGSEIPLAVEQEDVCNELDDFSCTLLMRMKRYTWLVDVHLENKNATALVGDKSITDLKSTIEKLKVKGKDALVKYTDLKDDRLKSLPSFELRKAKLDNELVEAEKKVCAASKAVDECKKQKKNNPAWKDRFEQLQKSRSVAEEAKAAIKKDIRDLMKEVDEKPVQKAKHNLNQINNELQEAKESLIFALEAKKRFKGCPPLRQKVLLNPICKAALDKFNKIKHMNASTHSDRYIKKIGKIESQLFDCLLSLMHLGVVRSRSYRRGENFLSNNKLQTESVALFIKEFAHSEDQKRALKASYLEFRNVVRNNPIKYT